MSTIPKDENKVDEMVDIWSTIHCDVPILEFLRKVFIPGLNEHVDIREVRSFPIFLQGDYLTAERSRGAQKIKINTDSPSSPYEGLVPATGRLAQKVEIIDGKNMNYHVVHICLLSMYNYSSVDRYIYYIPLL